MVFWLLVLFSQQSEKTNFLDFILKIKPRIPFNILIAVILVTKLLLNLIISFIIKFSLNIQTRIKFNLNSTFRFSCRNRKFPSTGCHPDSEQNCHRGLAARTYASVRFFVDATSTAGERPDPRRGFSVIQRRRTPIFGRGEKRRF